MELSDKICDAVSTMLNQDHPLYPILSPVVAQMLLAQLPKNVSVDDCESAIVYAGAFTILSIMQALDDNELASFDAGTLKLDFRERNDSFAQIAKQLMAPWCNDQTAFCGVRT